MKRPPVGTTEQKVLHRCKAQAFLSDKLKAE